MSNEAERGNKEMILASQMVEVLRKRSKMDEAVAEALVGIDADVSFAEYFEERGWLLTVAEDRRFTRLWIKPIDTGWTVETWGKEDIEQADEENLVRAIESRLK